MIQIIAIGKIKERSLQVLIEEYAKRMRPIHPVTLIELQNSAYKENEIQALIDDESSRILSKIQPQHCVILLDLTGKNFSSFLLSELVTGKIDQGAPLVFVIGGSHGVNAALKVRANYLWKLSDLTFPHQMVRLLLYEQLYRSFMISRNHPYHK